MVALFHNLTPWLSPECPGLRHESHGRCGLVSSTDPRDTGCTHAPVTGSINSQYTTASYTASQHCSRVFRNWDPRTTINPCLFTLLEPRHPLHGCLHIRHQCYHHHKEPKSWTRHQGNPTAKTFPVGERDQEVPSSILYYCGHTSPWLLRTPTVFDDADLIRAALTLSLLIKL